MVVWLCLWDTAAGWCILINQPCVPYAMALKTIPILTESEWDELCEDLERGPTEAQREYVRESVKTINNLKSVVKSWE